MDDRQETGPRVRVQLQVHSGGGHPNEVVRKCTTKGNEVVEVNSFKFVRKRKTMDVQPAQDTQHTARNDQSVIAAEQATALEVLDEAKAEQQELPEQPNYRTNATQLASVLPDQGQEQCPDTASTPPAYDEADGEEVGVQKQSVREQDLTADIGSLLNCIPSECPAAVSVTWLLRQALRMAVRPGDSEGAAVAASVLQNFEQGLEQRVAAAQRLLQGDTEHMQQFDMLPPLLRSMCASERLMATMRQQLAALEQEEKGWLALEEKYREGGAASSSGDVIFGDRAPSAASGSITELPPPPCVDVEVLAVAHRRAEAQLAGQVEAVHDMLGKAGRLVAQAQQACSMLQAEYHKENFQSYLHINSPQVLVKILSQAAPHALMDFVPESQRCHD